MSLYGRVEGLSSASSATQSFDVLWFDTASGAEKQGENVLLGLVASSIHPSGLFLKSSR
jgi:hypothetical protein